MRARVVFHPPAFVRTARLKSKNNGCVKTLQSAETWPETRPGLYSIHGGKAALGADLLSLPIPRRRNNPWWRTRGVSALSSVCRDASHYQSAEGERPLKRTQKGLKNTSRRYSARLPHVKHISGRKSLLHAQSTPGDVMDYGAQCLAVSTPLFAMGKELVKWSTE